MSLDLFNQLGFCAVYPPSFKAIGLVPFNINPHYIDTDPDSTHKVGSLRWERGMQSLKISKLPPSSFLAPSVAPYVMLSRVLCVHTAHCTGTIIPPFLASQDALEVM